MGPARNIILRAAFAFSSAGLVLSARQSSETSLLKRYTEFEQKHGFDARQEGTTSREERINLFAIAEAEVEAHNSQPGILWEAEVNRFADSTPQERRMLLGYKPSGAARAPWEGGSSFLEVGPARLADAIDWPSKIQSNVRDQGACGSCWAVAAAGALEMHAEIAAGQKLAKTPSHAQLVDCVPNEKKCGGDGGCKGATAELAFQYAKEHGVAADGVYAGGGAGDGVVATSCHESGPKSPMLRTTGFVQLPVNKAQPLMEAVATKGPVAVSVDADGWFSYKKGIFNSCKQDAIVNHAVLAVGYGTDETLKQKYWLIRNSWGEGYGEPVNAKEPEKRGYIRLLRHDGDEYCGIDKDPLKGVGCPGGPETVPVCGMCGVLSDSSYPTGVTVS